MKVKRYWKKILSLVLTSALLLGLLPTAAFAYSPDEKTDIIEFKAMVLENLTGGTVSEYSVPDHRQYILQRHQYEWLYG